MTTSSIRILGLTLEDMGQFRSQRGKNTGLFAALSRRFDVVGFVQPALPAWKKYLDKLRYPADPLLRMQKRFTPETFRQRIAIAEQKLRKWDGYYDVIVQLHLQIGPGSLTQKRAYVIHTDNAFMITERYYPLWAPQKGRQREEWISLEREIFQNAAFMFPRSEFLRRSLIDDYGCDPRRVIRVGGGANLKMASLDNKPYDSRIALFVGMDFERKGGLILLKAWETVHKQYPKAQLWIVGPKSRSTPAVTGVHWFGRVHDREMLAQLYRQATLFVMPSVFEPWGHVFFEAMGHGLPCIGSACCAMPEIIQDGVTGLLVPPADPEMLAEALLSLLGDPERAEIMGCRAHSGILQGHTWDDVVSRMAPYIELAVGVRADTVRLAA